MAERKPITKQQILLKLTTLCARAEHCQQDMLDKMRRWEVAEDLQAEVMAYLVSEKYIDEVRYTRFFVNDKVKYNRWGRLKVEQALRMKHIPESIYRPILNEMDDTDNYHDTLLPLLTSKIKTVKGRNDYEIRIKLIRFALSRGFSMDIINKVMDEMGEGVKSEE